MFKFIEEIFLDHPREVGMTFDDHFGFALTLGFALFLAGLACMLHAFLPFIFKETASKCIKRSANRIDAVHNHDYLDWFI